MDWNLFMIYEQLIFSYLHFGVLFVVGFKRINNRGYFWPGIDIKGERLSVGWLLLTFVQSFSQIKQLLENTIYFGRKITLNSKSR